MGAYWSSCAKTWVGGDHAHDAVAEPARTHSEREHDRVLVDGSENDHHEEVKCASITPPAIWTPRAAPVSSPTEHTNVRRSRAASSALPAARASGRVRDVQQGVNVAGAGVVRKDSRNLGGGHPHLRVSQRCRRSHSSTGLPGPWGGVTARKAPASTGCQSAGLP